MMTIPLSYTRRVFLLSWCSLSDIVSRSLPPIISLGWHCATVYPPLHFNEQTNYGHLIQYTSAPSSVYHAVTHLWGSAGQRTHHRFTLTIFLWPTSLYVRPQIAAYLLSAQSAISTTPLLWHHVRVGLAGDSTLLQWRHQGSHLEAQLHPRNGNARNPSFWHNLLEHAMAGR